MDDTPQYVPEFLLRIANINTAYLFVAVILLIFIYKTGNILDIIYFGVVTFYYIRIKIHRWKVRN